MALAWDWEALEADLGPDWRDARLRLELEAAGDGTRAIGLLAPLQPVRTGPAEISLQVVRAAGDSSPEAVGRALARLDAARIHGTLSVSASASGAVARIPAPPTLAEAWDAALATLPADWSDLLGELELASSDYLEPGAVQLAPINPRRVGGELRLQFRCARRFGYGAAPQMVRGCLMRCDAIGIRGRVQVVHALSDSDPVGTQGPVWHIDGRFA